MAEMNDDAEYHTIGEVARAAGLSISALRFYDRHRVFTPAEVDAFTGYRRYSPAQLQDAKLLERLRRIGLPVAEIGRVLVAADPEVTRDALAAHLERLEQGLTVARAEVAGIINVSDRPDAEPGPAERSEMRVGATDLLAGLRTVRHAVGDDPDMPSIHGVFVVGVDGPRAGEARVRLAATDRHRAAFAEIPAQVDGRLRALLPSHFVDAVLEAEPRLAGELVVVLEAGEVVLWRGDQEVLHANAPEAAFPDLSHAIPKGRSVTTVPADQLPGVLDGQGVVLDPEYLDQALQALGGERVPAGPGPEAGTADPSGPLQLRLDLDGPGAPLAIRRAEDPGTFVVLLPIVPEPRQLSPPACT